MSADVMGSPPENGEAGTCLQQARPQIQIDASKFSYPKPTAVKGKVLGALLRGESLTHFDVWDRFGSSRAAHHVLRLRQAGWPVRTIDIDVSTSDGRVARIARYELPLETIAAAGEAGQRFAAEVARIETKRRAA